ncbi:MAG: cupin domain-containing protein [Microbacterium sp.]
MTLAPGEAVPATSVALEREPLPAAQVVSGAPATGFVELTDTVGVWEHTPGVSTDVEVDEVFVVLSGSGVLTFDEPALPPVALGPGVVVRLVDGMRTTWTVHETLRKAYVTP